MRLEELKNRMRAAKLHPVQVKGSSLDNDVKGRTFIGTLDEYFEVAKALETSVVLISTEVLEETRFSYALEGEGESSDEDAKEIDLCGLVPKLSAFKKHIGNIAMYKL